MLGARGVGGDGPVAEARAEVARASAGVAGVLVDRGKEECIAERRVGADEGLHNGFGAVAVMGVEIPDGHTAGGDGSGSVGGSAGGREGGREIVGGVNGRERDLVQITEAHRMARAGVVAGRPHEGKNRSALRDRVTGGREGGGGGAAGVVADVLEERGVRVEVAGLREAFEMRGRVREEERGIVHRSRGRRHAPFPGSVSDAEVRGGAEDAGRLLRAQRGAVVGALRIVENEHGEIVVIPPHRGRRRNLKKENENE